MSREPVVVDLALLEGCDLKEAELVRTSLLQQLNSDRGGAVLTSLVDFYLETSSAQAVSLLSAAREQLHKLLLEKLNDALGKAATRLAALTLLGHLTRKQPPWVHLVPRCPLLASLLRCLKTEGDVVVLSTGVLVLVTLLPMIPQCGKQLVYDFFDVFGRLASWSLRNPAQAPALQLLHLQGALYSLFHRLYGMFPVNFLSYLRLHYSMKENTDTFQRIVKPMLDHVRVHPELVTGTQEQELDPSRWRRLEVHDIVIECSRLSLDPLEASSEDLLCSSSLPPAGVAEGSPAPQASLQVDVTWSPSSHCGLSTPPPERHAPSTPGTAPSTPGPAPSTPSTAPSTPGTAPSTPGTAPSTPSTAPSTPGPAPSTPGTAPSTPGPAPSTPSTALSTPGPAPSTPSTAPSTPGTASNTLGSASSIQDPAPLTPGSAPPAPVVTRPSQASVPLAPPPELARVSCHLQQPIASQRGQSDAPLDSPSKLRPPAPVQSYEELFELALPRSAPLFVARKTKEALQRAELHHCPVSPLELLDQLKPVQELLMLQGDHAHQQLLRSSMNKCLDRSSAGPLSPPAASVEELSVELLLLQNQLQFERFKRQQHAMRNRRLLRSVIQSAALEEQRHATRAQVGLLEAELQFLRDSLEVEQRRLSELKLQSERSTSQLQARIQDLSSSQQGALQDKARLQSELLQCQERLKEQEAELQRANHKAYNAQHRLSQLSIKVSGGEELQQHLLLLDQELILLREANRTLRQALDAPGSSAHTEALLLQGIVGNEVQHLKEREVQLSQALDSANHRAAELETQVALKEQLILEQKRLLEDCKSLSRSQLSASESRCAALRSITQSLQTEVLHLYSQVQSSQNQVQSSQNQVQSSQNQVQSSQNQVRDQDWGFSRPRPSASVDIANSANAKLQPLYSPPIESPLTVGSFLEREARRLFGPANQSPTAEETSNHSPEEAESEEGSRSPEERDVKPEQDDSRQAANHSPEEAGLEEEAEEVQEEMLLAGSPPNQPQSWAAIGQNSRSGPAHSDLTLAVRQRRLELSLMDYNESGPES